MADGHQFNSISLGGHGGANPGQLRIHSRGIQWKKLDGTKAVEVDYTDVVIGAFIPTVVGLTWTKVPQTNQLGVRIKDGLYYKFLGFRDQDMPTLTSFSLNTLGITPEEKQLSVSGKNWGEVDLNGNMLSFMVGSKQAFEVSLADVTQSQLQGKNDLMLEFHVDDTTGAKEKDSLMEISFHVPESNAKFGGDENRPSAQVLQEEVMFWAAGGEEAVVSFNGIAVLTPRGRHNIELHLSFLRLQAQANVFKIQYSSIVRLFVLPKSNQPHTYVVVSLDPPIRKGQTLYPHIVMQFETESLSEKTLSINQNLLNTKYKDKLESSYKGLSHEVFAMVLRGLSGARITRPGKFRSVQDGYAVKSSLKAEDGVLYPLEKSFFFLPKPPTLIFHEEIDYVEFERHSAGGSNMQYFDLLIRLKIGQEHLFRNIQRNEYHTLLDFISGKGLRVLNLGGDGPRGGGVARALGNGGDNGDVDPHLERIKNAADEEESDEEDSDFVAEKDDSGSPTDDSSGEEGSDASETEKVKEPAKKKQKKGSSSNSKASKSKEGDGLRKIKQKKDPNAPKKAQSSFFFYLNSERDNVKKSNPGIGFTDISKVVGEKWRNLTAEEKAPFEAKAKEDKKRYQDEMASYTKK